MKKSDSAKLYIILLVSTAFIFSFSYFGTAVYGNVTGSKGVYTEKTMVGSVDITGLTRQEAYDQVLQSTILWQEQSTLTFNYKEKDEQVELSIFSFDVESSMQAVKEGGSYPLLVEVNEEDLALKLLEMSPELTSEDFQEEKLKTELLNAASVLHTGSQTMKLQTFFAQTEENQVVAEATVSADGVYESLEKWTQAASQIEIEPQSQLSLLKYVDENGLTSSFSSDTLSYIASAMYKTVLSTNFLISERHISRLLPAYAEAGYEAKVDPAKNMDFIISNTNDSSFTLEFKLIDNHFHVSLKGSPFLYEYSLSLEDKEVFKPKTIVQYDAKLRFGEEKTVSEGTDGVIIKLYREVKEPSGSILRKEFISDDFYPPVHKVIVKSLIANTQPNGSDNNGTDINSADTSIEDETGSEEDVNADPADDLRDEEETADSETGSDEEAQNAGKKNENDLWGHEKEAVK
ncbi:G5 domain-containing protein [Cytobacillus gottheilii]|uniref:G5 domain-containing protein n=1 Tax=Cytobacillus gottheilii TaxID=859144 RepID=UPI0009B9626B|nr:G5 domain-containing protein [Cytobacillus gottheilii]